MGLPEDEQDLSVAAKTGDKHAFGELVRRHQRSALRVAAIAGADAEDALQEGVRSPRLAPEFVREDRTGPEGGTRWSTWLSREACRAGADQISGGFRPVRAC
jgi:DNA-directed RNA polymerase specialized sigma24 family protein